MHGTILNETSIHTKTEGLIEIANLIDHLQAARDRRLGEIAREEATTRGYRKFRPIVRGPVINALLIGLLAVIAPFYLAWRALLGVANRLSDRARLLVSFGGLVVLMVGIYWNHFDNDFQFDDYHTIVNNAYITDLGNLPRFFTDVETTSSLPLNQSYRPVVTTMNAIDYWLAGGLDTRVFHWHIFIEFIVILALVFSLASHLFRLATGSSHHVLALLTAAFFGVHTATAETVNYIIARSDVFSTLMVLVAMLVFVSNTGWRRHWAILPFIVGCLTKPTAIMLAPLLAVYSLFMLKPSALVRTEGPALANALMRTVISTGAYFVIGALLFAFTRAMYSEAWTPGGDYSRWDYLTTQAWVIWIYVKTFFLPTELTADTDLGVISGVFSPRVLWGLAVILILLALAWLAARRRVTTPITFGILWFFIALVPSSSVIPLAEVMNNHRTFFPYIGFVIAVVWGGYLLYEKLQPRAPGIGLKWFTATAVTVILAAHAYGTVQRNEVWHSSESLWRDVTIKSPDNGRGLMNYGLALMRKGETEQALDYFRRARDSGYGNHPFLYTNMAIATNTLADRQQSQALKAQAEAYYKTGIQKGPNYPEPHYWYAQWLHRQGREEEALGEVNRAIALSPGNKGSLALRETLIQSAQIGLEEAGRTAESAGTPEAWLNLSLRYYNLGQYEQTIEAARKALALRPDYALAYNNICSAHIMLGAYDQAISACQRALEIDPGFERARNNLDWARQEKEKP